MINFIWGLSFMISGFFHRFAFRAAHSASLNANRGRSLFESSFNFGPAGWRERIDDSERASSREPSTFPILGLAQNVQDQLHIPFDLEIEHADTNVIGPVLEGVRKA